MDETPDQANPSQAQQGEAPGAVQGTLVPGGGA